MCVCSSTCSHSLQLSEEKLLDMYIKMVAVCDLDQLLFKAHKMVGHCRHTPSTVFIG